MRGKITSAAVVLAVIILALLTFFTQQKLGNISDENHQLVTKVSSIAEQTSRPTPKQVQQQIDDGGFQALFLDDINNTVYFGKLKEVNANYFSLTDVYYLSDTPAPGSKVVGTVNDTSLIKLGSEPHGPKDYMYIPQAKVEFMENLKNDSKVVKVIHNYEAK